MSKLNLKDILVVGISSRALFKLEDANIIYEKKGLKNYTDYQLKNVNKHLKPGTGFRLIKNLLSLNTNKERVIEVIILSRNNAATSLRITKSIEHYNLDITRSAWIGGEKISRYLKPYHVDLFLSAHGDDVKDAVNKGIAAARIYKYDTYTPDTINDKKIIKLAFDGDSVIFSSESEDLFQEKGLTDFLTHEKNHSNETLSDGPFANLIRSISILQNKFKVEKCPIRTALITARNSPAHERVIITLEKWGVRIDEVHFLGGIDKSSILEAFKADIFFDDQDIHCLPASKYVPTAIVPTKKNNKKTQT